MIKVQTAELKLGDATYRLRWDMGAIATFEGLTGENALVGIMVNARNIVALLWAAIDGDAASRDEDAPISFRRFGSLLDTDEKMTRAIKVASKLLELNAPEPQEGKKSADPQPAATPSRGRRRAATRSGPSTSQSQSASTGG